MELLPQLAAIVDEVDNAGDHPGGHPASAGPVRADTVRLVAEPRSRGHPRGGGGAVPGAGRGSAAVAHTEADGDPEAERVTLGRSGRRVLSPGGPRLTLAAALRRRSLRRGPPGATRGPAPRYVFESMSATATRGPCSPLRPGSAHSPLDQADLRSSESYLEATGRSSADVQAAARATLRASASRARLSAAIRRVRVRIRAESPESPRWGPTLGTLGTGRTVSQVIRVESDVLEGRRLGYQSRCYGWQDIGSYAAHIGAT